MPHIKRWVNGRLLVWALRFVIRVAVEHHGRRGISWFVMGSGSRVYVVTDRAFIGLIDTALEVARETAGGEVKRYR